MADEEREARAAALPGKVHADDDWATAARGEEPGTAHDVVDVGGDAVVPATVVAAEATAGAEAAEVNGGFDYFDFIMPRAENLRPTPPVWGESAPAPPMPREGSAAEPSLPRWVAVTIVTCAISCLTCAIACIVIATAFVSTRRDARGGEIRDAPPPAATSPAAASPAVPTQGATADSPFASSEADAPEIPTIRALVPPSPQSPLPHLTGTKWSRLGSTAPAKSPRRALPHGTSR